MVQSKFVLPIVFAVFLVLLNQTQGKVPKTFAEQAKSQKLMASQEFQDKQEKTIMAGSDGFSLAAQSTLEDIRNEMKKFPIRGKSAIMAVNAIIKGFLDTTRIAYYSFTEGNKAIEQALDMIKSGDSDGAAEVIEKGLKADRIIIFISGVSCHNGDGSALAISGPLSFESLRKSIYTIQNAGSAIFESLHVAREMAIPALNTGGIAAEASLKSAQKVLLTGLTSAYSILRKAVTHAMEGVTAAATKSSEDIELAAGVIQSLTTNETTDNYAASDAIVKLSNSYNSFIAEMAMKEAKDAASALFEGVKATITLTANAFMDFKKSIPDIKKLAEQDEEAAVEMVVKVMKKMEDKLLDASAFAYLAFGAAAEMTNNDVREAFVPDVIEVENGRVLAYEDMKLGERNAIFAIRGGMEAANLGLETTLEMCNAAIVTLNQDYVEAAQNGFETLKMLN